MCQELKSLDEKDIEYARVPEAIQIAAMNGTVEFIVNISKAVPELILSPMFSRTMFEVAIINRRANVFSLIHGTDTKLSSTSLRFNLMGENMLHVTGRIAPPSKLNLISGAALQMQRELQWFKEVETIVTDSCRLALTLAGKTPREVFTESHKDLVIAGESWMKDTSTSSTVVGALIVTIMFTAAFTIPGGNNQETGLPIFLNEKLFKGFIVSDAMSLFSATTSLLMFLGILTSRYAEDDFLKSLPTKMIIGLSTLFFSIATMMIAFCAALSIMFHKEPWIVVPLILLAAVPVTLFVWMQFPLLVEIFMSTYGPSIFDRNAKNWLHAHDPHAT
ncbi:PGG domain containing protein [Parasponia andersonii]|uniref:PGG domain containing protein n=1 Tax=Parasponia andersonii TaxID=3476 RepID=A0A2P5DXX3_PARAD|nr:PGG domain containing protein [Parasponia andersonii]